jgi:hypothetical protein
MWAVSHTLHSGKPTKLVIQSNNRRYGLIDKIDRIQSSGVFESVTHVSVNLRDFWNDVIQTQDLSDSEIDELGNSIFERHLEPKFSPFFSEEDFDAVIYYAPSSFVMTYYIQKHFKNIIIYEDGYNGISGNYKRLSYEYTQAIRAYKFIARFVEKGYFPTNVFTNKNVKKIISSCPFPDGPDGVPVEERDFFAMTEENKDVFQRAMRHIFSFDEDISDLSGYFVYGPSNLYRAYSLRDKAHHYYRLTKMIGKDAIANGEKLIIKKHPGNAFDYRLFENERTRVLPHDIPLEYYSALVEHKADVYFNEFSTSTNYVTFAKKVETLCGSNELQKIDLKDIPDKIIEYVENETIGLSVFLTAHSFDAEILKILSDYKPQKTWLDIKFYLIIPKEAEAHLDNTRMDNDRINIMETDSFDERDIFNNIICMNMPEDYFILTDMKSDIQGIEQTLRSTLNTRFPFAIYFPPAVNVHTMKKGKIHSEAVLAPETGFVKPIVTLVNTLYHKKFIDDIRGKAITPLTIADVNMRWIDASSYATRPLHVDIKNYINEDISCFIKEIDNACLYARGKDEDVRLQFLSSVVIYELMKYRNYIRVAQPFFETENDIDENMIVSELLNQTALSKSEKNYIFSRLVYEMASALLIGGALLRNIRERRKELETKNKALKERAKKLMAKNKTLRRMSASFILWMKSRVAKSKKVKRILKWMRRRHLKK